MHFILSSNMKGEASHKTKTATQDEITLRRNMAAIGNRVDERFKYMQEAFRFMDLNYNNSIGFNEFTQGMESLKVKMSIEDQLQCFKHLDKTMKGFIDYKDFCNLSEERRLGIDPAKKMLDDYSKFGEEEMLARH